MTYNFFHHLTQETLEMLLRTVRKFYIRHVLTHEEYMRRTQDGSL
jgi:mRNA-degrading endonuclease HigB of HigAB toxin-antitoxin module